MKNRVHGFSLIEVIISLGIVSFALIGLIGLMPLGLSTLRQSITVNTETEISQTLAGEAQMLDFSKVTDPNSAYNTDFPRYYNDVAERTATPPTSTTISADSIYKVALVTTTCSLPGIPPNSPPSPALRLVFQITNLHKAGATQDYYSLWVVNNGR